MKRLFSVLFFFTLFTSPLLAQNDFFEAGYIIQQQDTVRGFIERTSEIQLSHSIKFRIGSGSGTAKEFFPQDISGFGFAKDRIHFIPAQAEIRKDKTVTTTTRFAKVLLTGHTSLYKLQLPEEDRTKIFLNDNTHIYLPGIHIAGTNNLRR